MKSIEHLAHEVHRLGTQPNAAVRRTHSSGLPTNALGFARVEGVHTRNDGREIQLLVAGEYYAWSDIGRRWVRVGRVGK